MKDAFGLDEQSEAQIAEKNKERQAQAQEEGDLEDPDEESKD